VESGRLTFERVAESAARVRETAEWASVTGPVGADGGVGAEAARRALRLHGDARVDAAPLVVELVPEANLAAGETEHGLADAWPGAVTVRVRRQGDMRALAGEHPSRPLVLVVRDAARHEWQQEVVRELLGLRAPTVVIETGLPGWRPPPDVPLVETAGAGRANLTAAVERLRGAYANSDTSAQDVSRA
jgi:beta-N-acetylhexosaminidase